MISILFAAPKDLRSAGRMPKLGRQKNDQGIDRCRDFAYNEKAEQATSTEAK